MQESSVQGLLSLQSCVPFTHPPGVAGSQLSSVHGLPSSQLCGACWQPVVESQESSVQGLPSSQLHTLSEPVLWLPADRFCRVSHTASLNGIRNPAASPIAVP